MRARSECEHMMGLSICYIRRTYIYCGLEHILHTTRIFVLIGTLVCTSGVATPATTELASARRLPEAIKWRRKCANSSPTAALISCCLQTRSRNWWPDMG